MGKYSVKAKSDFDELIEHLKVLDEEKKKTENLLLQALNGKAYKNKSQVNGCGNKGKGKGRDRKSTDYQNLHFLEAKLMNEIKNAVLDGLAPDSSVGKSIVLLHKRCISLSIKDFESKMYVELSDLYAEGKPLYEKYNQHVLGGSDFLRKAMLYWAYKL